MSLSSRCSLVLKDQRTPHSYQEMAENQCTQRYQKRIKNDILEIYTDPVEGIYVCPDDEKLSVLHALIIGPKDTPYDGGFFYFLITYPEKYPLIPPKVKLMTTGDGKVRFNPNLYACGKVCLSILGTWSGPGWTSVMTTKSVLISIQSLMCENPFYNEPGFEGKDGSYKKESEQYNQRIHYQRLEVAVNDMVERSLGEDSRLTMPQVLKEIVIKSFFKRIEFYEKECKDSMKMDGKNIDDRYGGFLGFSSHARSGQHYPKYDYKTQLERIKKLKDKIKIEENMADDLYESLRTAYRRTPAPGEESATGSGPEMAHPNDLFEPEYSSDDEVVDLSPDISDEEEEEEAQASTSNKGKTSTASATASKPNGDVNPETVDLVDDDDDCVELVSD